MDYKEIIGNRKSSGICHYSSNEDNDDGGIVFILDGNTYYIGTDPNDGYRSYCKEMILDNSIKVDYKFTPQDVLVYINDNEDGTFLEFSNFITDDLIVSIGTDYSEDYYPSAHFTYNPEALQINVDSNTLLDLLNKLDN